MIPLKRAEIKRRLRERASLQSPPLTPNSTRCYSMVDVPVSFTAFERRHAGLPPAVLKNRFFEETPTQQKVRR